jgi:hypothetical protein
MGDTRFELAALVAVCLLAALPPGPAQAAALTPDISLHDLAAPAVIPAAQDAPRFHHGKRAQSVYCLRRNYWWFYRPYTTAPEDFARCEPYFHYLEPAYERRGARRDPYFK